jgi:hypothetical protein
MRNQIYARPVRWIVVDDGPEPQDMSGTPDNWQLEIIRRKPYWKPGDNTQAQNIMAGLERVKPSEKLVIIEDDDYYRPGYLQAVDLALSIFELVGESHTTYLNIANGVSHKCANDKHASLCATGMTGSAIPLFSCVVNMESKFIDIKLWEKYRGSKLLTGSDMVIGIKGLPGRPGIGAGHRLKGEADYAKLEAIIGPDAIHYKPYMNQ